MTRTFQNVRLFNTLSVLDNLLAGYHLHYRVGVWASLLRLPSVRRSRQEALEHAERNLALVGLEAERDRLAGQLPFGKQRLLELARALMVRPRLLLLDEPAAGLNTAETSTLGDLLLRIREQGVTLLLIEHDMALVMRVSDDVVVLNFGQKIAEGSPAAIRDDPRVIEAYLGTGTQVNAAG